MPLVPGYNFVRAGALLGFQRAFTENYPLPKPESVSVIQFLRLVAHRTPPPHECLMVTGFDRLWQVCEDDEILRNRIHNLLKSRADWLNEHIPYVYFIFPPEVQFEDAYTVKLLLPTGEAVDLDATFGKPQQFESDRDHYNRRSFALS